MFGEIKYDEANTYVGMDMELVVVISNKGSEPRTVSGTCKISSMYYTGVLYKLVKQQKIPDTVIAPNSSKMTSPVMSREVDLQILDISYLAPFSLTLDFF